MSAIGLGAELAVNDGTADAFVAVADLVDVDPPEDVVGTAQSKRVSLSGGTITKVATLKDPGAFTFRYEFSKANKARIDALKGAAKQWRITLPDGSPAWTRTVPGILTSNKVDQVVADEIMTVTATVEVTGPAV